MKISRYVFLFKLTIIVIITSYTFAFAYDNAKLQDEIKYLSSELYKNKIEKNLKNNSRTKKNSQLQGLKSRRKILMENLAQSSSKPNKASEEKIEILNLEDRYFSDEISTQFSAAQKSSDPVQRSKTKVPELDHSKL